MLPLNWKLGEMLVNALKEAQATRLSKGITTMDLMKELIEDSESVLYSYLIESTPDEEIEGQISDAMKSIAARNDIRYNVSFALYQKDGRAKEIFLTQELLEYLEAADRLAFKSERKEKRIYPIDVLTAIFEKPSKEITKFLRSLRVDIPEVRENLELQYVKKASFQIPEEMESYMSVITADDTVLGRNDEIDAIWNVLLKRTKRNVILIGEPGVGKTAIIKKMASQIKNGKAPEEFHTSTIFSIDVNNIVSGTKYRGDTEKRFKQIGNFIKSRKDVILFIDEAHMILGAGRAEGTTQDMANALKPIMASENSRIIAATTNKEYQEYFSKDPAFKRRFETVEVGEPKTNEVYSMIKARIQALSKYHHVSISRQMVDFIVLYSSCFESETKNPDRTLDLIDKSMVVAKRRKKKFVDYKCVLANFKAETEFFNAMAAYDKEATAYHEAGHFIACYFLPYMKKTRKVTAVSIYPAKNHFGITCTETRKNAYTTKDRRAYLEEIAFFLAGGIAERKIAGGSENDGVSSDSRKATEMAKMLISKTGFFNDFFYQLDSLDTEKSKENQVESIKKILDEAKRIAENVIQSHNKELDSIAKALLQRKILSEEELEKVVSSALETEKQGLLSCTN